MRQFLGMVQYYCDLWPKRSEILALLTESNEFGPTKQFPIKWNLDCTEAFQQMKALIAKETILTYSNFLKF